MNHFICALALAFAMIPHTSFACGPASLQEEQENTLLLSLQGVKLICLDRGAKVPATLQLTPKYRCANSPVYGTLQPWQVKILSISRSGQKLNLVLDQQVKTTCFERK